MDDYSGLVTHVETRSADGEPNSVCKCWKPNKGGRNTRLKNRGKNIECSREDRKHLGVYVRWLRNTWVLSRK